jgi:NAD(P)-dependent dehydrogenase (short-subunit alcohol dehydrogenase family)
MSRVWLVTGCSRGIGRAIAEAVLAEGYKLIATSRNPAQLADLVERYGDHVRTVPLDVTDERAARHAVQAALDAFGRLDVVVNSAGCAAVSSIEDTTLADFRAQIETNLFGVVNVTKAAIPVMREQGSGYIIQFSSIGGRLGTPGLSAYQTAKWAVQGFSEVLLKEVGSLGIKVTIIEPGAFRTDWAGASMTVRESRPEYDATVGAFARYNRERAGAQRGDPAKAAGVIIHIATLDEPPLRLPFGSDAVHLAEQIETARIESDKKWRDLGMSTDFEAPGKR